MGNGKSIFFKRKIIGTTYPSPYLQCDSGLSLAPMLKLSRGIWRVRAIYSSWRKGLRDESHFRLTEVFVGHVVIKDWIRRWETRALVKFLLRDLKSESQVQVEGSGLGMRVNFKTLSRIVCCQTNCLSVARRLVSVARLSDEGANPLFVCCHLSNWSRKGRWISLPKACDCLGLAMVCCMSWTPIPITVSTVWQWIEPRPPC